MLHLPFLEEAVKLVKSKKQVVGDGTDRLVSYITAMIFAFCAMIVAGKQLMGTAMTCFTPKHFKGDQSKYALDYCYIQNTYVVAWQDADIALNRGTHNYEKISYYQWIALYYAFLAVLFYLPSHLWRNYSRNKQINLEHIVAKTSELRTEVPEERQKGLESATSSVIEVIRANRVAPCGSVRSFFRESCLFSLTMVYFTSKLVNIFIVVYTLFKVAQFLHDDDFVFSIHGIEALLTGTPWVDSPNFPRVTMCDVPIRDMGNVRKETFQCLLGMNYFSEKLFVIQWIWLTVVLIITLTNLAAYCHIFIPKARSYRLKQWLRDPAVNSKISDDEIEKLLHLLGIDGYLALYFVDSYNGSKAAGEFADYIYKLEIVDNQNRKFLGAASHLGEDHSSPNNVSAPTRLHV